MRRLFDPSTTRRRRALDGPWDFLTDPENEGIDAEYYETFPDETDRFDVPAAWNVDPDYYEYEGPAWYRRRFEIPQSGTTRIAFDGICHDATVWLDGEHVADHYCGYTSFEVVADIAAGEHELVIRADNTRDERSIPKPAADWRPYGGITREVTVESVPETFVDDVAVDYELDGDRAEVLELEVDGDSILVDRPIRESMADLPEGVVLGAITRGHDLITPRGYTVVEVGDHVVVFADETVLSEVTEKL